MQSLSHFINENQLDKIVSTKSNSERRRLLKKYLQGKYSDYLEKLEDMCKDVKTQALLDDAFGGVLGDTELKFSEEIISVKRLMPTQNEIGLEASLKFLLTKPENVDEYFKQQVQIKSPIITFNKAYVIDGHHRWSEILCGNPDAKVICLNYDGDLSIIQMLKATQGAIAAAVDYVPQSHPKGENIYECSEKEIRNYIEENITEEVIKKFCSHSRQIEIRRDVIDYIMNNVRELIDNHPILHDAPERSLMPQTNKGGGLDKDGALSKMKDGDVLKI